MKWIGDTDGTLEDYITTLPAVTSIGSGTLAITASDVTLYDATNDGNPTISLGSSATNRLKIESIYHSGAQTYNWTKFTSLSSSGTGNAGRFGFFVDESALVLGIKDDMVSIGGSMALEIGTGNTILSDSSGTTTLSNIDDLDATTIATIFNRAITIDPSDKNITPAIDGSSSMIHLDTNTLTDTNTAEGGTVAAFASVILEGPTMAATNPSTITHAATLYVKDAPTAGTNSTLTNTWALWVDSGNARFDGNIDLEGDIDVNGTLETDALTIGGTALTSVCSPVAGHSSIATVGTIGTGVWQGTKITPVYTNAGGRRYGSTIKILPSDFMINDDAASPLSFKDGSNSGVHVNDTANEAIAFVAIPEGMKATALDIYATHTRAISVYEVDLNASFDFTGTADETGNCNTQITIDPNINATATNYLAIIIALNNSVHRIWGGVLTIANQ